MSNPLNLDDLFTIDDQGKSHPLAVKPKTMIPQHYDTPVLEVEEQLGRIIVEIRAGNYEYYNQIIEQLITQLPGESNAIRLDTWNEPGSGRLIVDY